MEETQSKISNFQYKPESEKEIPSCRICLENTQENLLSPCKCKGSTQFIHEQCLLEWALKNNKHRLNPVTEIFELECEICKYCIPLQRQTSLKLRQVSEILQYVNEERTKIMIESACIISLVGSTIFSGVKYREYRQDNNLLFMYLTLGITVLVSISTFFLLLNLIYDCTVQIIQVFSVVKAQGMPCKRKSLSDMGKNIPNIDNVSETPERRAQEMLSGFQLMERRSFANKGQS